MPLQIVHQDITTMKCDAIVNPTDCFYSGSGGTDGAIHSAAGSELALACRKLKALNCGEVSSTSAFKLPGKYIIHTVGPVWKDGDRNEEVLLRSCYINSLIKAKQLEALSVAFPLISAGTFGFPKDKVLRIATDAISDFLFTVDSEMMVYICIIDRNSFRLSEELALKKYLSESCHPLFFAPRASNSRGFFRANRPRTGSSDEALFSEDTAGAFDKLSLSCAPAPMAESYCIEESLSPKPKPEFDIKKVIELHDDTFAVLLLKLIDKKGMGDVECYKKANVSKNTFWKINNDAKYRPSKPTVIAFAIALELTIEETEQLLRSAGFALSGNNYFDVIIKFYISNGIYDIFEINAALYQYDQVCLGC